MAHSNFTLCVSRTSSQPVIVRSPKPTYIPEYHILIKVDRFAFSANNITCQALADHPHFRYFDFYPVPEDGDVSPRSHGIVPVWGFGTVIKSHHPKVQVGERLYGYFAPTRYLVLPISPTDFNEVALYVPRPHLPPDRLVYSQLVRCSADPLYTPYNEDLIMLYRPLFWTSYWCEDWLFCSDYRGGCQNLLISSASSKTAYLFAYYVRNTDRDIKLIGLTSKSHVAFTKHLGLYDEVYAYESFPSSRAFQSHAGNKWIYVDVTGNNFLNAKIHNHFASDYTGTLVASISLGLTNKSPITAWTEQLVMDPSFAPGFQVMGPYSSCGDDPDLWPKREQFFTPEWVAIRKKQLPLDEICAMQKRDWGRLMRDCVGWVEFEHVSGQAEVAKAYERALKRGVQPDKGLIWSLWEERPHVESGLIQTRL